MSIDFCLWCFCFGTCPQKWKQTKNTFLLRVRSFWRGHDNELDLPSKNNSKINNNRQAVSFLSENECAPISIVFNMFYYFFFLFVIFAFFFFQQYIQSKLNRSLRSIGCDNEKRCKKSAQGFLMRSFFFLLFRSIFCALNKSLECSYAANISSLFSFARLLNRIIFIDPDACVSFFFSLFLLSFRVKIFFFLFSLPYHTFHLILFVLF